MATRSSRRKPPAHFQQLSFQASKEKRPKKSNKQTPTTSIKQEIDAFLSSQDFSKPQYSIQPKQNYRRNDFRKRNNPGPISMNANNESIKEIAKYNVSTSRSKIKQQIASSIVQPESCQPETTLFQLKKSKKSTVVAPRSKLSRISLNEIANLGQSITRLPSQDLAMICFKYGQCKEESSTSYRLQLQKMPKQTLFELQAFVKTIFKQKDWKYGQLKMIDSDDDFVIDSDGSQAK